MQLKERDRVYDRHLFYSDFDDNLVERLCVSQDNYEFISLKNSIKIVKYSTPASHISILWYTGKVYIEKENLSVKNTNHEID